jgi:hypothetical protein
MKQFKFEVEFEGDMSESVMASCYKDAVILACAERIKKGFHCRALKVVLLDTGEFNLIDPTWSLKINYRS